MTAFEKVYARPVPLRDSFRALKAFFSGDILRQLDNNGVYAVGGHLAKLDYPVNTDLVRHAAERFSAVYETYFADAGANVYYSVVPDKNYFLAEQNGYPAMDYELLTDTMRAGMTFAEYIDIFDTLSLDMYYRTDTHWRQETLGETAAAIAAAMGASLPAEYETVDVSSAFRGVYAGQYALPVEPDALRYLTNGTIAALRVYDYRNGRGDPCLRSYPRCGARRIRKCSSAGRKHCSRSKTPTLETDGAGDLPRFVRQQHCPAARAGLCQGHGRGHPVYGACPCRTVRGSLAGGRLLFLYSTGVLNHSETIQ